ncbi:MAG: radical SAM protein [bacterium]
MSKPSRLRLDKISFRPALKKIAVDNSYKNNPRLKKVLSKATGYGLEIAANAAFRTDSIRNQKSCLQLTAARKKFIKLWPAAPRIVGKDEWCLLPVEGCVMDCCYCYLQGYLSRHYPVANLNTAEMINQLDDFFAKKNSSKMYDFSLGELSDGLYLEPLLNILPELWKFFEDKNGRLEIRTKSHHVHNLPDKLNPHPNGVFCWTISPPKKVNRLELFSAPFKQRLAAMQYMLKAGFKVGIRFDPIILSENWKTEYSGMIKQLKQHLDLNEISYIVAGTFRFPAGFDKIMQKRFPGRDFLRDELIKGPDGKYRYPRRRRSEAYKKLKRMLGPEVKNLSLCMEPHYIWEDSGLKNQSQRRARNDPL